MHTFKTNGEITHSKSINVDEGDTLYLDIKVAEGYLIDATVDISNANFKVEESEDQTNRIQSISQEENKVSLNQINKDESVILNVPVKVNTDSNFNANDLSKTAQITLRGTYVNNKGKEVEAEKTIEVKTDIDGTAENEISAEVLKYVPFNVNGTKGVILQTSIASKLKDNKLPVKTNKLEIEIPIINKSEPNTITIFAKSSMATNGNKSKVFSKDEYTYEDGILTLELANNDEILSWVKDVNDEIILTCVYGEEAVTENAEINFNAKSAITYYAKELKETVAETNLTEELSSQIGEIVTLGTEVSKDIIYKGYMLEENGKNTEFVDKINVNIGYSELIDGIVLKDEVSYVLAGKEYKSNALYTYSKVEKENIVEILGEDGYINVFDENGNQLSTLNKDNLEIEYENEVSNLRFETSKPIAEGIISIENGREIKPLEYTKDQIEKFEAIKVKNLEDIIKANEVIIKGEDSKEIKLENTTSQAELTISKQNISTVQTNENVEIRATLKTTDASTALYKDPKVQITLPNYIKDIKIENVKLLYEKELKIENASLDKNENGNYIVDIDLKGEQTGYNEVGVTEGATLIMNSDITADELTPTRTENVTLTVENQNKNEVVTSDSEMNFVAPIGMATVNKISEYNSEGENATSISGKEQAGKIAANADKKTAKVEITATNNYDYNTKNIKILGRIPFAGNKSIKDSLDLGSTFGTTLKSNVTPDEGTQSENIKIYYSESGTITKDASIETGSWEEHPSDLSKIKSFLIVMGDEFTFEKGNSISFTYDIEIPATLGSDQSAFETFAVYSTRVSDEESHELSELHEEVNEATKVGITTGAGPDLAVTLSADKTNNSDVVELSQIKYTVTVKNNAKTSADNVTVTAPVPGLAYWAQYDEENDIYVVDYKNNPRTVSLTIDSIPAGESKNVDFVLQMNRYVSSDGEFNEDDIHFYDEEGNEIPKSEALPNTNIPDNLTRENFNSDEEWNQYQEALKNEANMLDPNKISVSVTAQVEGFDDTFESNTWTNNIIAQTASEDNKKDISMEAIKNWGGDYVNIGEEIRYSISLTNETEEELTNVVVKCKLPEGMTFVDSEYGKYDSQTREITWNIDKLDFVSYAFDASFDKLPEGTYEKELSVKFTAKCNEIDETFESEEVSVKAVAEHIDLSQTSNISDGYLSANEEITYTITVKNLTPVGVSVSLKDTLPMQLKFVKASYVQDGNTINIDNANGNDPSFQFNLAAGEIITVYVTAKAIEVKQNVDVTNTISLSSRDIDNLEGNSITHTLLGLNGGGERPGTNPDGPGDNPGGLTGEFRLSGTAWIDSNKNGAREDDEMLLQGLKVYLLNNSTRAILSTALTNNNGVYTFLNLPSGNYVVVFEYDTNKYELTTYQISGVDDSLNSDAIDMTLTLNGNTRKYGATNTINLSNNTYNIDIGLLDSPKFDLELEKTITLVQVSNSNGTKSYTFNNTDSAQVQIPEKQIKGSTIAITYEIKVKNTGAVAGYANRIADYKAKDLNFSSTLNPEWYEGADGTLYTTELSGKLINPGETAKVSLILTKTMTSENVGLSNNSAEIAESSNDKGLVDVDSTQANKNASEDDYDTADVIVAVKTGGVIFFGLILLTVIAIFAVGIYEINKRVLSKI